MRQEGVEGGRERKDRGRRREEGGWREEDEGRKGGKSRHGKGR